MADDRPDIELNGANVFPGKGAAWFAARIMQLKGQIREASLRDDWPKVDELQKEISNLEYGKTTATREGRK